MHASIQTHTHTHTLIFSTSTTPNTLPPPLLGHFCRWQSTWFQILDQSPSMDQQSQLTFGFLLDGRPTLRYFQLSRHSKMITSPSSYSFHWLTSFSLNLGVSLPNPSLFVWQRLAFGARRNRYVLEDWWTTQSEDLGELLEL